MYIADLIIFNLQCLLKYALHLTIDTSNILNSEMGSLDSCYQDDFDEEGAIYPPNLEFGLVHADITEIVSR